MADTVDTIIRSCLPMIGLPKDPVQADILAMSIDIYNFEGERIWNSRDWDNAKMDEFTAPAAINGVITFLAPVDVIRAIRFFSPASTDFTKEGTYAFNENEILAARQGTQVSTDRFQYLSDSATGCRRIRVAPEDASMVCRVLALSRFTPAIVDPAYDVANPAATPTDYRVLTFALDRAKLALKDCMIDVLRDFQGLPRLNRSGESMLIAVQRENSQQNREKRLVPAKPMFRNQGLYRQ